MKERKSNIELLRIIAIVMIVFAHLSGHGIMAVTSNEPYSRWAEGSLINRMFSAFFVCGGDTGVGVFFMITGFFMIKSQKARKLTPLIFQIIFYAILSTFLLIVFNALKLSQTSSFTIVKQLVVPISGSIWWFISAYILLCVSSLYINSIFAKIEKKTYGYILFLLWVLWITIGKALDVEYYPFVRAIWYYLLGGYISKYDLSCKKGTAGFGFSVNWFAYAVATYLIAYIIGTRADYIMLANALKLIRSNIFGPLSSIFLFLLFKDIKLNEKLLINKIASCSLGVYLLHESYGGRLLFWKVIFNTSGPIYDSIWYPLYSVFVVICILMIGITIDSLRKTILEPHIIKFIESKSVGSKHSF